MVNDLDVKLQNDMDTIRIQSTLQDHIVKNLYICEILCIYLAYYVFLEHTNDIVVISESRYETVLP